jgi:hypothetical protein
MRMLANVALYFACIPTAYAVGLAATDKYPHWLALPLYYAFTTPSWPLVIVFIPLITIIRRVLVARASFSPRGATLIAAALVIGLTAFLVSPSMLFAFIMLLGALAYGALFRFPLAPGVTLRPSSDADQ